MRTPVAILPAVPARLAVALCAGGCIALALPGLTPAGSRSGAGRPAAGGTVVGHSVRGRPIRVLRVGSARARRRVLVVGSIHGGEPAGRAVIRRLRRVHPPRGVAIWLVDDVNPDGAAVGTRQNAHGVDLNRNFPYRWRAMGRPFDTNYPGPRPLSEPESSAAATLIGRIRPRVTIWYHQALRLVTDDAGDAWLERLYARRAELPRRRLPRYPGTAISWQNHRFRGDTAFVVELPGGPLSRAGAARHAGAVLAVARAVAPPRVVKRPIPFGRKRKREMRAYARRHYGIDDYRLRHPHVIVEHYTDNDSFQATYNTFAPDVADSELGELPGVCSHYVVDRDGKVYGLVSTRIMCRHTVGLNYTAIGIEHVGRSDGQVLGNRRQLRSSLRLTRMLQGRYGIRTRDVIGHNESLDSPFHRERVRRLRRQTHGDFRRASMRRYRRALRRLPAPTSLR
jgi:N-acetylmuramoyl-L-alanine amidase-like protein/zinc carboxypeptidase